MYVAIHEDADNEVAVEANVHSTLCQNQHRATPPFIRAVDLCRYVQLFIPATPEGCRRGAIQPGNRIVRKTRIKAAPDRSDQRKTQHADKNGMPKRRQAGMTCNHDEWISTSWRMHGFGQKHITQGQYLSECINP